MEIKSFDEEPTTNEIRNALSARYGAGEIDNDGFHTNDDLTHVRYMVEYIDTGYIFDNFQWVLNTVHVHTISD